VSEQARDERLRRRRLRGARGGASAQMLRSQGESFLAAEVNSSGARSSRSRARTPGM